VSVKLPISLESMLVVTEVRYSLEASNSMSITSAGPSTLETDPEPTVAGLAPVRPAA